MTRMEEFDSDDHYIYYCGLESLGRNGVALIVNRRVENAVLGCCLKNDLGLLPRQTIQHHSNPTLCPNHQCQKAEVEWFYADLQDLLELTSKIRRCPSHHRGLESKSRKSRNTWINRQVWPWSTKWSKGKTNRVLSREHTGHSKHHLTTTQETILHTDVTRWSILKSDWLYSS